MPNNIQSGFDDFEDGFEAVTGSIAYWMNGGEVQGEHIGNGKEPPLRHVAEEAGYDWGPTTESAYVHLRNNGFLKTKWICRRKVEWVPTEKGLDLIENIIGWRSPFGGLVHTKIVAAIVYQMEEHPSIDIVKRQPENQHGKVGLDLGAQSRTGLDWLAEGFADDDPQQLYDVTYERCAQYPCIVLWGFPDRAKMVDWANHMHQSDSNIELTSGFLKNAENWSAGEVTERVSDLTGEREHYCFTITSLIENEPILELMR